MGRRILTVMGLVLHALGSFVVLIISVGTTYVIASEIMAFLHNAILTPQDSYLWAAQLAFLGTLVQAICTLIVTFLNVLTGSSSFSDLALGIAVRMNPIRVFIRIPWNAMKSVFHASRARRLKLR